MNKNKTGNSWSSIQLGKVLRFIGSKRFFYLILLLLVVQTLWYIFSVNMVIFDEAHHVKFIMAYADRLNPFISHQPTSLDSLGEITRDPSYLFYYLMSFVYRFIRIFADTLMVQVIAMRVVMMVSFAAALVMFRKLFLMISNKTSVIHLTLLLIIMIPGIAPLAGTVNYDNIQFLFVPMLLIQVVKIIQMKTFNIKYILQFLIVGFIGSLIKFTYIIFFVTTLVFIIVIFAKSKQKMSVMNILKSYLNLSMLSRVILTLGVLISMGLFIERPVKNVIVNHSIKASCVELIGRERCLQNYTLRRTILVYEKRADKLRVLDPAHYLLGLWVPGMLNTTSTSIYNKAPLPIMEISAIVGLFMGSVLIIAFFREYWVKLEYRLFFVVGIMFVIIEEITNYRSYIRIGVPVAIAGRYLLPVLPFFVYFMVLAASKTIGRNKPRVALTVLIVIPILFLQGGGVISNMTRIDDSFYWDNQKVIETNSSVKNVYTMFVVETNPFRRI